MDIIKNKLIASFCYRPLVYSFSIYIWQLGAYFFKIKKTPVLRSLKVLFLCLTYAPWLYRFVKVESESSLSGCGIPDVIPKPVGRISIIELSVTDTP